MTVDEFAVACVRLHLVALHLRFSSHIVLDLIVMTHISLCHLLHFHFALKNC